LEWYGSDGGRQRHVRSAAAVQLSSEHVVVHRPGEVLAMDTSPLPVKVREHLFGDTVTAQLILGLDVYAHSPAGFRLSLVSDTSVDVAMLLREVMTPIPLREEWGEQARWCYPAIPAQVALVTAWVTASSAASYASWLVPAVISTTKARPRRTVTGGAVRPG
jgi:hypothetical protein